MFEPSGTRVIISTPQLMTMSSRPAPIIAAPIDVACWLDPHCESTVVDGDLERQAGGQPRDARDVERLLAYLRNAAADHLADLFAFEAAALQRGQLHGAEQVGRHQAGKTLAAFADRAAYGFDDVDVLHRGTPVSIG